MLQFSKLVAQNTSNVLFIHQSFGSIIQTGAQSQQEIC
jgi:hypothetical protein